MNETLDFLRRNARMSNAEIAKQLGKSEQEVAESITTLEKDKVVLGYHAIVNPEKADNGRIVGIIEVKLSPERDTGFDAIARRIYRFPEVKLCYLLSGAYDLLVFVEGQTLHDVALFVAEKLAPIDHVTSTTTHFILKKYKEDGVVLGEQEAFERLAVTP
jgi:DNA-binding Lrp family transcriptional regulator